MPIRLEIVKVQCFLDKTHEVLTKIECKAVEEMINQPTPREGKLKMKMVRQKRMEWNGRNFL